MTYLPDDYPDASLCLCHCKSTAGTL